jgi:hypothetical protein
MSLTLRILLIIGSLSALIICFRKFDQSKLKVDDSIGWIVGCFIILLMSIFSDAVMWLSTKLGFMAPSNFVFFVFIVFLLVQVFNYTIKLSQLSEKLKNIDHYLALKENKEEKKK